MDIPKDVLSILRALGRAGHDAYIVGGCVRDSLMGGMPHDWDITTSAIPKEVQSIFPHNYESGIKHGTITVILNGGQYEITTFRVDGEYRDFRRPEEVLFSRDITEDLSRRDFTINAIAYKPSLYIDPFDGAGDINNRLVRGVGDPNRRFQEDALRMLRAIRFASRLSFRIEDKTYDAILRNAHLITHVSMERIRDELTGIITSPHPEHLSELIKCGLMRFILPDLTGYFDQYLQEIILCLEAAPSEPAMAFSILFMNLSPEHVAQCLSDLRFDNKTIRLCCAAADWANKPIGTDDYSVRKAINLLGSRHFEHVLSFQKIVAPINGWDGGQFKIIDERYRRIVQQDDCTSLKDLAVNGSDLIGIGICPGKDIGDILSELLELVLQDQSLNTKFELLVRASTLFAHKS